MVAEKCQRRFFAFVPVHASLEFGAVARPRPQERHLAFFFVGQAPDGLKSEPFRFALRCGRSMVLNSRVQVLNQFVRRHLDPKSIDHSSPPVVTTRCNRLARPKSVIFQKYSFDDSKILMRVAWPRAQFLPRRAAASRPTGSPLIAAPLSG